MHDSLSFTVFDPLRDAPEMCSICESNPPVFHYEFLANESSDPQKGFCCRFCAVKLLGKLERAESQEWAEEEAALRADDQDVSGFRQRRLATFSGKRN